MGGGISRAAAHRLCGGRSWQLLGHGRWLRGRMGLPGRAVFDLRWVEEKKMTAGRPRTDFPVIFFPPPLHPLETHIDTIHYKADRATK